MNDYQIIAKVLKYSIVGLDRNDKAVNRLKRLFYDCLHKAKSPPSVFISKRAKDLKEQGKAITKDHYFGRFKVFEEAVEMTVKHSSIESVALFLQNHNGIIMVAPEENDALREFQKAGRSFITYNEYISVTGKLYKRNGRFWKDAVLDVDEEAKLLFTTYLPL